MKSEFVCTLCFALAILHTFLVTRIQHAALKFPEGSVGENVFHLLGETEVVFGIRASFYLSYVALSASPSKQFSILKREILQNHFLCSSLWLFVRRVRYW